MTEYHEPFASLDEEVRDLHRALASLREEIEAVDWYTQRISQCKDPELARVIEHNRDEEIEHACLALAWLRRQRPEWREKLDEYLFSQRAPGTLVEQEENAADTPAEGGSAEFAATTGIGLGIGGLKGGWRLSP